VNQIRHLIDSRAANRIGPSGCWLLSVLSVSGRAEWWDDELAGVSGLGSRSTLGRVRDACVDAGFLRYEQGARGRPAVYTILSKFDAESGQNVTSNVDTKRAECDAESRQKPQRKKQQRVTATVEDPAIPHEFDTDEFREAWKNWILYRSGKRKPVSIRAAKQQLAVFLGWVATGSPVRDLVASIEQSIANDWQGLFEHRGSGRQVVDKTALANFLRAGDGQGEFCTGDGVPASGGAGASGGANPQRLLAFAQGSGPGGVATGGSGSGGESSIPHTAHGGGDPATRTGGGRRHRSDLGGGIRGGVPSGQQGGGELRNAGATPGGAVSDAGIIGGDDRPILGDDLPF
jgi:hypothetical protein